jgi:hypothetical protein
VPAGAGNFSLHHRVQTGSGAHPASYRMDTSGSYPGVKRQGRKADHSSLSSAEVINAWSFTSTQPVRAHGVVRSLKWLCYAHQFKGTGKEIIIIIIKLKLSLCLTKHNMKAYGGVEVYLHAFLTSALDGSEWSASRPGRFTPMERAPGTHWIGG